MKMKIRILHTARKILISSTEVSIIHITMLLDVAAAHAEMTVIAIHCHPRNTVARVSMDTGIKLLVFSA